MVPDDRDREELLPPALRTGGSVYDHAPDQYRASQPSSAGPSSPARPNPMPTAVRRLLMLLPRILPLISAPIRGALKDLVDKLAEKAATTESGIDDLLVGQLRVLLGLESSEVAGEVAGFLPDILELISPELREALNGFVLDLQAKAKETSTYWDDFLVGLLKAALGVKGNPQAAS